MLCSRDIELAGCVGYMSDLRIGRLLGVLRDGRTAEQADGSDSRFVKNSHEGSSMG